MAIVVDERSRVIVQGVTGTVGRGFAERLGQTHAGFVGGVAPGRGGQTIGGRSVFDSVAEAVRATGADASLLAIPARFATDAVLEAIDAGISTITIYTDLIPVHETLAFLAYARRSNVTIVGPNAAGVISPGRGSISELNDHLLRPGRIGVISKSGSLTYEIAIALQALGHGESTVCCLGGDPVIGLRFAQVLDAFENDRETSGVVLLGEVGGLDEIDAAKVIRRMTKPVVAYIAGHSALEGKSMGHAGAIVARGRERAGEKSAVLAAAGAQVVGVLEELPEAFERTFGRKL